MRSWQQLPREPNRAFALFQAYLGLGPGRSLPALARSGIASLSYLKKLSSRWWWRERVGSWQVSLTQAGQVGDADLARAARERQLKDALALQQLARAQLARWLERDPEGTVRLMRRLTPHQVARFWQTGAHLERELLPPSPPEQPVDAERRAQEAKWRQEREQEREQLSLSQEIASLLGLLAKAGVQADQCQQIRAQLLRWLWLSEEQLSDKPAIAVFDTGPDKGYA